VSSLLSVRSAGRRGPAAVLVTLVVVALTLVFGGVPGAGATPGFPMSGVYSPAAGSVLAVGTPVLVTGGAANGETGGIISVEVSLDGGATWELAEGTETWSFTFTPTEPGQLTIVSRAATDDVVETPTRSNQVTVGEGDAPPRTCPCRLLLPPLPNRPMINDPDDVPVELGLRFTLDRPGVITGLDFVHFTGNDGPHVGHLWTADGELLATATPAATGFLVRFTFSPPVPVQAGSTYVASYYTPSGHYASTVDYFSGALVLPPFSTVFDENGGAGVYRYGSGGGFPDQTWNASNYWVAPTFSAS
jgi:Domain of unknown function (DUF4082)/Bacterial Ig domain